MAFMLVFLGFSLLIMSVIGYMRLQIVLIDFPYTETTSFYTFFSSIAILIAGLVLFLMEHHWGQKKMEDKKNRQILKTSLFLLVFSLGYAHYYLIYSSVVKIEEKAERRKAVVDKLLDLQFFQQAYKKQNQVFADSFDKLFDFIKTAKEQTLIRIELKALPKELDQLSEKNQLEQGYFRYDTIQESLLEKYFLSAQAVKERAIKKRNPFDLKQLQIAPERAQETAQLFIFEVDQRKDFVSQQEQVFFQIKDPTPYLGERPDTLKIGNLIENTANGNWTEK